MSVVNIYKNIRDITTSYERRINLFFITDSLGKNDPLSGPEI